MLSGQFLFRWDLPGHQLLHGDHSVVVLGQHRFSQQPLVISNGFASLPAGQRFWGGVDHYEVQRDLQFGCLLFAEKLLFGS